MVISLLHGGYHFLPVAGQGHNMTVDTDQEVHVGLHRATKVRMGNVDVGSLSIGGISIADVIATANVDTSPVALSTLRNLTRQMVQEFLMGGENVTLQVPSLEVGASGRTTTVLGDWHVQGIFSVAGFSLNATVLNQLFGRGWQTPLNFVHESAGTLRLGGPEDGNSTQKAKHVTVHGVQRISFQAPEVEIGIAGGKSIVRGDLHVEGSLFLGGIVQNATQSTDTLGHGVMWNGTLCSGGGSGRVGEVLFSASDPGPAFVPANATVLQQDDYPELFQVVGLLPRFPLRRERKMYENYWQSFAWSPKLRLFAAVSGGEKRVTTSPDGLTWTTPTVMGNQARWSSVVWVPELSKFVAIGESPNHPMTSMDGITWNVHSGTSVIGSSLVWSPERSIFVAVGSGSSFGVYTSVDGVMWNSIPGFDGSWRSVTWSPELSLFVAVGSQSSEVSDIMTSSDGTTWVRITGSVETRLSSVVWAPELGIFVAVGGNGNTLVSEDGEIWAHHLIPLPLNLNSIAWSPEAKLFLAGASPRSWIVGPLVSSDGLEWEMHEDSESRGVSFAFVSWLPEWHSFVALTRGLSGSNFWLAKVDYNATHQFRTPIVHPPESILRSYFRARPEPVVHAACESGSERSGSGSSSMEGNIPVGAVISMVGDPGPKYLRTNGSKLSQAEYPELFARVGLRPDVYWRHMTLSLQKKIIQMLWVPERHLFLAISNDRELFTSSDGMRWFQQVAPVAILHCAAWSPQLGLFLVLTRNELSFMTSTDARTWTVRPWAWEGSYSVGWSPVHNRFVAAGNQFLVSSDGITWTDIPTTGGSYDLHWCERPGIFVVVRANSILTSSDGLTWTSRSVPEGQWSRVACSSQEDQLVAVGYDSGISRILTSSDGISWAEQETTRTLQDVEWLSPLAVFIAVGYDGMVLQSTDGSEWEEFRGPTSRYVRSIVWASEMNLLVFAGDDGQITTTRIAPYDLTTEFLNIDATPADPALTSYVRALP